MADSSRIDELRRRVQKDPASIAFAQLGEELRRAGEVKEAVAICRTGLAVHPGYVSARVTLGRALMELGDLDNADVELRLVLKSTPDNLPAIKARADIFRRRGDRDSALAHYRVALGLARNDPDLLRVVDELSKELGVDLNAPAAKPPVVAKPPAATVPPAKLTPEPAAAEAVTVVLAPPAHAPAASAPVASAPPPEPPPPDPARERALQTIAALEHFLAAVHGVRTDERA
jgi:tetratricopeptide (TPR) repeat protein